MTATLAPEKYDEVTEALKDVMDPELAERLEDEGYDRFIEPVLEAATEGEA